VQRPRFSSCRTLCFST